MKSITLASDTANTRLAIDPAAAADLRARLAQDSQGGMKQVAQQFEGMLLQLLLKSMRDATISGGMLDSQQSSFFTALGDQQMALNLATQMPMGLAELIEQQQSGRAAKAGEAEATHSTSQRNSRRLAAVVEFPVAGNCGGLSRWRSPPGGPAGEHGGQQSRSSAGRGIAFGAT
jgi:flagellar protein FlgJ